MVTKTYSGPRTSSLNTLGYSPISFEDYYSMIQAIMSKDRKPNHLKKPVIVSITGTPDDTRNYHRQLCQLQVQTKTRILMEINLSCPNIAGIGTTRLLSRLTNRILERLTTINHGKPEQGRRNRYQAAAIHAQDPIRKTHRRPTQRHALPSNFHHLHKHAWLLPRPI